MPTTANLPINTTATAMQMAQTIFGPGVTVVGASYTGDPRSSGIYSDGDAISPELTPGDTGVILSTGRATSITNSSGAPNQSPSTTTNTSGPDNDPWFNAAAGQPTFDAAYLDIDFIPTGDLMTMQFVFASEEFPEYTFGDFQDFVGVWINGSLVPIAIGSGEMNPENLNGEANPNLYFDNAAGSYNTEMDGFTATLTLTIPVNPGEVNSIRIGIADVLDAQYDSNLLIAANSLQTVVIAETDELTLYPFGQKTLDVMANDT